MLSQKDNEYMSRIGADTAMGSFVRRFWTPLMLSDDLPETDGTPQEVRLFGEDLVAFRDTADSAVIALRRILIKAARDLESGDEPYAPYHGDVYRRSAWSAVLPRNDDFLNDPLANQMHVSLVL